MMDNKTKAEYERAAVLNETHDVKITRDPIAEKAWLLALDVSEDPDDWNAIELSAARLLRECIAADREMP